MDNFGNKYPGTGVQYIENHPNKGSAKTRNVGIKAANGEYVTFLDDDDVYLPKKIEKQYKDMVHASADYSITDMYLYSEDDKLIEKRVRGYLNNYKKEDLLKYHLMYHITGTDTMMFRREYLVSIGGFNAIDLGDEFYLMQKAIETKGKFIYVPGCEVKAYVHTGENGLSSGQSKIKGENQLYTYKRRYFSKLDVKTRRYIKMRHYAVLAFAYIRMKKYSAFFISGVKSFVSAPGACVGLIIERKKH